MSTSGHLPPAQNVDSCCITPGPDNTGRTLMSGWRRRNSSTTRIRAAASSGLAAKKKVNASSSSEAQPPAHGASDAAVSAAALRSRLRRPNGLPSTVFLFTGCRYSPRLSLPSLVPDGPVVLLGWAARRQFGPRSGPGRSRATGPARQCEDGTAQAVDIAGDVDRVDALVVSDTDPQ